MFEKIIDITPAYDKRDPEPSKNYGIHGCDLRMILKGDKGAVQFIVFTNWHLLHVTEEFVNKTIHKNVLDKYDIICSFLPTPVDIGYHSPVPRYDGQDMVTDSCKYLDGRPCYYDGSGLEAERVYNILLKDGSDGVWAELERYYNDLFGEINAPG